MDQSSSDQKQLANRIVSELSSGECELASQALRRPQAEMRNQLLRQLEPRPLLKLVKLLLHQNETLLAYRAIIAHARQLSTYSPSNRFSLLNNLALCLSRMQQYAKARRVFVLCESIADREGSGVSRRERFSMLNNRAVAEWKVGRYEDARTLYHVIYSALQEKPEPGINWQQILLNASTLERSVGNYGESFRILRIIIKNQSNEESEEPRFLARLTFEAALTNYYLANYHTSSKYIQKAIPHRREVYGDNSIEVARVYTTAALIEHQLGRLDSAREFVKHSFRIYRVLKTPERERYRAYQLLFQLSIECGHWNSAERLWLRCIDASRMNDGTCNTDLIDALHEAIAWRLDRRQFDRAKEDLRHARRMIRRNLPAGHELARNSTLFGLWLLLQKRFREARKVLLLASRLHLKAAREDLQRLDPGRARNLVTRQAQLANLILLACEKSGITEEVLAYLEEGKDMLLYEVLARRSKSRRSRRASQAQGVRFADLSGKAVFQRTTLFQGKSYRLGKRIFNGHFYAVYERHGHPPRLVRLGMAEEMNELLRAYSKSLLLQKNQLNTHLIAEQWERSQTISTWLLGPCQTRAIGQLELRPDGLFHQINPICLRKPDGELLVHSEMDVRILPGGTFEASSCHTKPDHVFMLGADYRLQEPVIQLPGIVKETHLVCDVLDRAGITYVCRTLSEDKINDLPGLLHTATVLHIMAHGISCEPADDTTEQATLDVLLEEQQYGLESVGILLESLNLNGTRAERMLTGDAISRMDLRHIRLVVLSLCNGGQGEFQSGFGLLSLRRAFELAGVAGVLCSPIALDDRESPNWIKVFYERHFIDRQCVSAATKSASIQRLKNRQSAGLPPDPAVWGAFQYVGAD